MSTDDGLLLPASAASPMEDAERLSLKRKDCPCADDEEEEGGRSDKRRRVSLEDAVARVVQHMGARGSLGREDRHIRAIRAALAYFKTAEHDKKMAQFKVGDLVDHVNPARAKFTRGIVVEKAHLNKSTTMVPVYQTLPIGGKGTIHLVHYDKLVVAVKGWRHIPLSTMSSPSSPPSS